MKIRKLNARGFSHDLLVVVFVVVFAIAGVAYLVASHADSCDSSTSGEVSVSDAVSGCPVSNETSGPAVVSGNCGLNYIPSNPAYNKTIKPAVTLQNTGNSVFNAAFTVTLQLINANGAVSSTTSTTGTFANLQAGNSTTVNLNLPYTTPYISHSVVSGKYTLSSSNPSFSCFASFYLPSDPVSVTVEGEYLNPAATVVNDSTASNNKYVALNHPISFSTGFSTATSPLSLKVRAKGTQCSGAPTMTIMVDNKLLYPAGAKSAQVPVTATEWTDYTFPIITSNANQKHIVGISYSNDFSNSVCDRNLHIDKLVFNEKG